MVAAEPTNRWEWLQGPCLFQCPAANSQSCPSFSLGPPSNKQQNCIHRSVLHLPLHCNPLSSKVSQEVLHQGERLYLKTPTPGNDQKLDQINLIPEHREFCSTYSETWWEADEYVENFHILHLEKDVIQGPRASLSLISWTPDFTPQGSCKNGVAPEHRFCLSASDPCSLKLSFRPACPYWPGCPLAKEPPFCRKKRNLKVYWATVRPRQPRSVILLWELKRPCGIPNVRDTDELILGS